MARVMAISPAPVRLRADGREQSADGDRFVSVITVPRPRLAWVVPLVRNGQQQTAYRIVVSTSRVPAERPDIWDSGLVESVQNTSIPWGPAPIPPHTRYFWSVCTRDENGTVSDWSAPSAVESAAYEFADWDAEWMSPPATHATTVTVPGVAGLAHARLSLAGWGPARVLVNETVVNDGEFGPTDSALARATSRTYDVTDLVTAEPFTVTVIASLGHYRLVLDRPRVLIELRIRFLDGTITVIGGSADWLTTPTEVTVDDPFYLEEHDLRPRRTGAGHPVDVVRSNARPASPASVVPNAGPPVRAVRAVEGRLVERPVEGVRVFDLGENVAGRVVLSLGALPVGCRVTSVQGEKLTSDGRVDTTNIRLPDDRHRERQVFAVVSAGQPTVASPWFAVNGFRYVEVVGLPESADARVSASVIHSDVERTGSLTTSVPELDAIVDYAVRTQLNNTLGLPEDCPTREQSGWTGDASVSAEAALAHLDLSDVYRNWLIDVALEADVEGGIPGVAPQLHGAYGRQPVDPVWGSAITEIPWHVWWATGDAWRIEPMLPAMRRWADWQMTSLVRGVVRRPGISFGADWLAPAQTPPVLLQTGAVVSSLRALADLEEALGNTAFAANRRAQAAEVVEAARLQLRDPVEGTWGNDSQGSSATALVSGLAKESDVEALRARLGSDVRERGDRLSSGFSATKAVVRALADADGGSALLDAVKQRSQPGIGAMLVDGPGTFWETWWIDDDNVGVASLDHIGLGAPFSAWVWRDVAGLRPLEPGFRRFAIEPRLTSRVTSSSLSRETPHGTIQAAWHVDGGRFFCDVTVPVGAVAEVRVPGGATVELPAGIHSFDRAYRAPEVVSARRPEPGRELKGELWLSDGALQAWEPSGGTTVTVQRSNFVCTPVYHEPIPAPTLDVVIPDFVEGFDHMLVMRQDGPLDLGAASFVFANFDTDNPGVVGRAVRVIVRLRSSDGTSADGTARPLPIAWNRVAVDVSEWPGRTSVVEVAVGIRWTDDLDPAFGPALPLPPEPRRFAYRLGRIGWSNAAITY